MTKEERQLLLVDLAARLPYGVVINYNGLARPLFNISPTQHFQITLDNALDGEHNGLVYISLDVDGEEPKPYLRPMSSMTPEEYEIYNGFAGYGTYEEVMVDRLNFLLSNHFDYRGLISKCLAIEALEGMYNIKEQ